jgi:hypothetical protein
MRPVPVEMGLILGQDLAQLRGVDDEHPVGFTLTPRTWTRRLAFPTTAKLAQFVAEHGVFAHG